MKLYSDYEFASVSMSADLYFIQSLEKLFLDNNITNILESGTFMGLGSTKLLANTILKTKKDILSFSTIEVDLKIHKKAVKNLLEYPFVKPVWGISINSKDAINFIQNDEAINKHHLYKNILIDDVENPIKFYSEEVNGQLSKHYFKKNFFSKLLENFPKNKTPIFQDNFFEKIIPTIKETKPLILLDSAGGLGFLEFKTVCKLMDGNSYFLILDDTHHLKHFRSYNELKSNIRFKILAENSQHGWVIAEYK